MSTGAPIISLRHAAFGYAESAIVRDVSLDIFPSEVVALLGPNGSGKSTLVKGLLGLSDHLGGEVRLFGTPRARFHDHARLGYVPQRHTLSSSVRASVEEIVAVGRLSHHRWWKPVRRTSEDSGIIARALDVVGLADRAHEDVSRLSGGQQRRVLIARALASQPDVLLMDEPTAGVDAANQEVLAEVLARLAARGTTMVVVTHELEALAGVLTRIVAVQAGRVAFDGPPGAFTPYAGEAAPHAAHHHDDEPSEGEGGRAPALPGSGPLDPRAGAHHG